MTAPDDSSLNDIILDQLVDGELQGERYQEVLQKIEQSEDGWKRCALAFLEAQAWQRDLGAFGGSFDLEQLTDTESETAAVETEVADSALPSIQPSLAEAKPKASRQSRRRLSWPTLGPAASVAALVAAFVTGWMLQPPSHSIEKPATASIDPNQGISLPASHRYPSGQIHLAVDQPDRGQQQFEVPYYEVEQYDNDTSREMDQWLDQVAGNGTAITRYRAVYPEKLNEKESVLVPIELISVQPNGDFQ